VVVVFVFLLTFALTSIVVDEAPVLVNDLGGCALAVSD
jgi:hypothetical protein